LIYHLFSSTLTSSPATMRKSH